jgi:hypothetical protein
MKLENQMKPFKPSAAKSGRLAQRRNHTVSSPAAERLPPQGNW